MQVSYFETARYQVSPTVPTEWPVPPGAYEPDAGAQAYQGMIDRMRYVEELGFDWISEEVGVGVLDLAFQNPGAPDTGRLMGSLELFAEKVLPRIRDV